MKNWHDLNIPDVLNELDAFINDMHEESERGCALITMALIEERLSEILAAFFIDNESSKVLLGGPKIFNAPLGSLSTRLRACHALGLITDLEFTNIKIMRDIRDEFAHSSHSIKFETASIAKLCRKLTMKSGIAAVEKMISESDSSGTPNKNIPRVRFLDAAFILSRRLLFRSRLVGGEKRTSKEWKHEIHEIFDELTAIEKRASRQKK